MAARQANLTGNHSGKQSYKEKPVLRVLHDFWLDAAKYYDIGAVRIAMLSSAGLLRLVTLDSPEHGDSIEAVKAFAKPRSGFSRYGLNSKEMMSLTSSEPADSDTKYSRGDNCGQPPTQALYNKSSRAMILEDAGLLHFYAELSRLSEEINSSDGDSKFGGDSVRFKRDVSGANSIAGVYGGNVKQPATPQKKRY